MFVSQEPVKGFLPLHAFLWSDPAQFIHFV
uniref:Uncharacterized protein n=1 Tax=Anguilla anguilla TaxID=7936 RepID=A0A0E9UEI4_ANGAN